MEEKRMMKREVWTNTNQPSMLSASGLSSTNRPYHTLHIYIYYAFRSYSLADTQASTNTQRERDSHTDILGLYLLKSMFHLSRNDRTIYILLFTYAHCAMQYSTLTQTQLYRYDYTHTHKRTVYHSVCLCEHAWAKLEWFVWFSRFVYFVSLTTYPIRFFSVFCIWFS